jgi:hypothetical protein
MVYPRQCLTERFVQVIVKYVDRFIQDWHTQRFFQVTVKHNDWFIQEARHCHTERFALVSQTYCQTDLPKTWSHREVCPSQTYWLVYSRHCHTVGLSKSKHIDWFIQDTVTQMSHREVCPRHTQTHSWHWLVYPRHCHTERLVQDTLRDSNILVARFIQDTVTQRCLFKS